MSIFATKPIERLAAEAADTGEHAHGELEPLFDNPVYME